jgi:hypothetical protein
MLSVQGAYAHLDAPLIVVCEIFAPSRITVVSALILRYISLRYMTDDVISMIVA